jgi:hypothetical protein
MRTLKRVLAASALVLLAASCQPTADVKVTAPVAMSGEEGKTALQLLKAVAKVETIPVGTTELIQSVNGTANNQTYRWQLYSGGKAVIGPSSTYMTKAGEQLEWRFESNAE